MVERHALNVKLQGCCNRLAVAFKWLNETSLKTHLLTSSSLQVDFSYKLF